jgi:hypothetical protein
MHVHTCKLFHKTTNTWSHTHTCTLTIVSGSEVWIFHATGATNQQWKYDASTGLCVIMCFASLIVQFTHYPSQYRSFQEPPNCICRRVSFIMIFSVFCMHACKHHSDSNNSNFHTTWCYSLCISANPANGPLPPYPLTQPCAAGPLVSTPACNTSLDIETRLER